MRIFFLHLCFVLICFCFGCESERVLNLQVANGSGEDIKKAEVIMGDGGSVAGSIPAGAEKTHVYYDGKITESALVKWIDSQKRAHEKKVDVSKHYQSTSRASGDLAFIIQSDDVTVRFTPRKQTTP